MRFPPDSTEAAAAPVFAIALAVALLLASAAASGDAHAPPNLLLISVDTLRADHLGAYGYPRDTTPAIDGLAREGILFQHAIVQRSVTWPSKTPINSASSDRWSPTLTFQL